MSQRSKPSAPSPSKAEARAESKADSSKTESRTESKTASTPESKPELRPEPSPEPRVATAPQVPEPSIDDILASIRRSIVPDDDGGEPAATGQAAPAGGNGHPPDAQTDAGSREAAAEPAADGPLVSPRTAAAVDGAFGSLRDTVASRSPPTLEDLVREMLRPMLTAWLDAHLPGMVERLVQAEIERLSRRG